MGEEEHNVSVKNISINGLLVQLNSDRKYIDIKYQKDILQDIKIFINNYY